VHLGVQDGTGQHPVVHNTVQQRPVSASFSIQPEEVRSQETQPVSKVPATSQGPKTVGAIIASHPKLTTLNKAVLATGLESTLSSPGHITVFAPTNLAFSKLAPTELSRLLGDKESLAKLLLRHVIPGQAIQGKNIPPGTTTLTTAGGEKVSTTRDKFIQLRAGDKSAYIVLFDVLGSNGVLHAIDTPL